MNINVVVNAKLLVGILLICSGLVIFNFPNLLEYTLASILVVSGIFSVIGYFRDRAALRGARFTRKDEDDS
ncbi:MAG: hypothetical protein VX764_00330 [Planctomycetota bacterium]|nr:hypothetical protein [Planctomycetota bacterium]